MFAWLAASFVVLLTYEVGEADRPCGEENITLAVGQTVALEGECPSPYRIVATASWNDKGKVAVNSELMLPDDGGWKRAVAPKLYVDPAGGSTQVTLRKVGQPWNRDLTLRIKVEPAF